MHTDTLGRRKRSQPVSSGKGVVMTPNRHRILTLLRRHPLLPTPLIYDAFCDGHYTPFKYKYFQSVMQDLTHETEGGGPFVVRTPELNPSFGPNYEPAWYARSKAGIAISEGDVPPPTRRDGERHRGMGSAISVSFEQLAPKYGLRYKHLEDIIGHPNCPAETRQPPKQLAVMTSLGLLELDDLMGLGVPLENNRTRWWYFACEWDRVTESFNENQSSHNTIVGKFKKYAEFFENGGSSHWGLKAKPRVLFLTTNQDRIDKCLAYLADQPYGDRFYFKLVPTFGVRSWRAPRKLLTELFEERWQTVNGPKHLIEG